MSVNRIPTLVEALVGDMVTVTARCRDADGAPVVPSALYVRLGLRGSDGWEVPATVEPDGLVVIELAPERAGIWVVQVDVTDPIQAVMHGAIRVAEPAFPAVPDPDAVPF